MPVTRLVLGLVLLGSVPSYAQCPPGLVPSGGSCCFPGQTFDPSTGTCAAERAPQPQGAEDQGGIFFRTGLGAGYGHYLYTETARNGGGPVLGSSFLIGYRLPMGLVVGGSLAFEPILLAWGQHSRGGGWGPSFGPGGYGGLAIGYARDLFEIDITVGFGGGGVSGGAGGFGLMVVPSFGVHVLSFQQLHIGLFARPTLGLLVDVNTGRFLVYPAGTIGVSVTYY